MFAWTFVPSPAIHVDGRGTGGVVSVTRYPRGRFLFGSVSCAVDACGHISSFGRVCLSVSEPVAPSSLRARQLRVARADVLHYLVTDRHYCKSPLLYATLCKLGAQ